MVPLLLQEADNMSLAGNMNKATVSMLVDQLRGYEGTVSNLSLGKQSREIALREVRRIRKLLGWPDAPSYNKRPAAA